MTCDIVSFLEKGFISVLENSWFILIRPPSAHLRNLLFHTEGELYYLKWALLSKLLVGPPSIFLHSSLHFHSVVYPLIFIFDIMD